MNALLAGLLLMQVQVREEPKDWKLLKSDHFDLHYPSDELEPRAKQFAGFFEDARLRIAQSCGVLLERRINVFLYKSVHDLSSAGANARIEAGLPAMRYKEPQLDRPRPERPCCRLGRSRAFAFAEPLRDRIFIHCQASDRWNMWFARHELVHQLQYQELYPWRLPSHLIAVKDPLVPQWFWEGFADYGAGIFDSEKDEWVRDLAAERLFTLKELFGGEVLNPHDYIAVYYQGSMFFRFLNEVVGAGTAAKVFKAYSDSFPLTMNQILLEATGRSREKLEEDFTKWIAALYGPKMEGRMDPTTRITDSREYYRIRTGSGSYSRDGKRMAWVSNKDVRPEVYVDGRGILGMRRGLSIEAIHSGPRFSPDSKRVVFAASYQNRDYLILAGVDGGIESILLDFDEVYDPAWAPNGDVILFAAMKGGTSDLYTYNVGSKQILRLTNDVEMDASPEWSPDGKRVAFIHETAGRTELAVMNLDGTERRTLGNTWARLEAPRWTADGNWIVVCADVGGVFDAFALKVDTGAASRLTKFRGGVHSAVVSPDMKTLLFTYFQGRGTDLCTVPFAPQEEKDFAQEGRRPEYDAFKPVDPTGVIAKKIRRWGVDFLMFPVLAESFIAPGLEFGFGDLDRENSLYLRAMYFPGFYRDVSATILNTRFRTTIGAAVSAAKVNGDLEVFTAGPFVEYPLTPFMRVSAGWLVRESTDVFDDFDDVEVSDSGPTIGFQFNNQAGVHRYDPSWGFAFAFTTSMFREGLGGERDLTESFVSVETSIGVMQDVLVWTRAVYERKDGPMLLGEVPNLESFVRGTLEQLGTDAGSLTVEVRFPIWRDLLWTPAEIVGVGELAMLKDIRGFLFADVGFTGFDPGDALDSDFRATSVGVGIRLDIFISFWPITTYRVPLRGEIWFAMVDQAFEDGRTELGYSINLGF